MRIFASNALNRVLISKELGIYGLRTAGSLGNSSLPSRSIAWDSSVMAIFDWNFPEKSALKGFAWQTLPVGDGGNCVFVFTTKHYSLLSKIDMRGLQVGAPQYGKPLICMRRTWIRNCAVDCLYQCIIACQCTSIRPSYELMLSSRENGPALPCWVCRVGWEFWLFFFWNLVKNCTILFKVFGSGSLSPIWLSSTRPLRGIFPAQNEPSMTLADVKGFFGSRYICLLVCDFSLCILGSFEKTNAVNFGKAEGSNQEQWRVHILKISLKNSKGKSSLLIWCLHRRELSATNRSSNPMKTQMDQISRAHLWCDGSHGSPGVPFEGRAYNAFNPCRVSAPML